MVRHYRKNLLLFLLIAIVVAAYVFAFRYTKQTQQHRGVTDEMVSQYRRDQAALCPVGFSPMSNSDSCFNLRGMIVPKLKQSAPPQAEAK
jgi:hypothetical protein